MGVGKARKKNWQAPDNSLGVGGGGGGEHGLLCKVKDVIHSLTHAKVFEIPGVCLNTKSCY